MTSPRAHIKGVFYAHAAPASLTERHSRGLYLPTQIYTKPSETPLAITAHG